ncbi:MAG: hypothetical protein ABFS43_00940 [Thermodesulfobacteriota bacterium]
MDDVPAFGLYGGIFQSLHLFLKSPESSKGQEKAPGKCNQWYWSLKGLGGTPNRIDDENIAQKILQIGYILGKVEIFGTGIRRGFMENLPPMP